MKKILLKNKLVNHIMINGNKKTSEKILLKSFKKLQKDSPKQSKKIFQLAIINSTPIFKLHVHKIKKRRKKKVKEIPAFIANKYNRISLAIKFMLYKKNSENKKLNLFFNEFKKEILLASQQKGAAFESKNNLQKQVLLKKRLFAFYRWK